MSDIANMKRKAKGGRTFRLRQKQGRSLEMLVPRLPGPHRGQRDHVRQIKGRDRRLTDVGVNMPWQAAEPGLDRVHRLGHAGEIPALDDLFDEAELFVGRRGLVIPNCDSCRDKGFPDLVRAQLLERGIGIHRLVMRVGIEKGRSLVGHHLLQDSGYRLPFREPLPHMINPQQKQIKINKADRYPPAYSGLVAGTSSVRTNNEINSSEPFYSRSGLSPQVSVKCLHRERAACIAPNAKKKSTIEN